MNTDLSYLIAPFLAWFLGGSLKFLVNSVRSGGLAFDKIGYGGFPSNHGGIVGSVVFLVAIKEGIDHPAFGVAAALAFIVVLDAAGLRRHIGRHAEAINALRTGEKPLRERIGHRPVEIGAGMVVGLLSAWMADALFSFGHI